MNRTFIYGLNKVGLLRGLWKEAGGAQNGRPFIPNQAEKAIASGCIHHFDDVVIGTSLNGMYADPNPFNKRYGPGSFEAVAARLRRS